jgi:hypothetical protein
MVGCAFLTRLGCRPTRRPMHLSGKEAWWKWTQHIIDSCYSLVAFVTSCKPCIDCWLVAAMERGCLGGGLRALARLVFKLLTNTKGRLLSILCQSLYDGLQPMLYDQDV